MASNQALAPAAEKAAVEAQKGPKEVVYEVNGEEVKLTLGAVKNFLTRGSAATMQEVVLFMSICRYNKLNPFTGECYLVKYGDKPANIITSKEAFMKRAEAHPKYVGYRAGVIILRNNKVEELEGSFYLPTDQLVGGWCIVERSDRKYPSIARVRLVEYNTGKSTWAAMPGTMIRKVAEAQAFREAFPMNLSGMYLTEEIREQPEGQPPLPAVQEENAIEADFAPDPEPQEQPEEAHPEVQPDPEPAIAPDPEPEEGVLDDSFFQV